MKRFEVSKLSSGRIRVIAERSYPKFTAPYCRELLAKMEDLYPEAREARIAKTKAEAEALIKAMDTARPESSRNIHKSYVECCCCT